MNNYKTSINNYLENLDNDIKFFVKNFSADEYDSLVTTLIFLKNAELNLSLIAKSLRGAIDKLEENNKNFKK